jgi:RND family efflux transporter MFP subunit
MTSHGMRTTVVVLVAILSSCGKGGLPATDMPTTVRIETLEPTTLFSWAEGFTRIESDEQALIYGSAGATVEAVLVSQGDSVENGVLLAVLDTDVQADARTSQASANLSAARAAYNSALDSYQRTKILFEAGARSRQEMTAAENSAKSAEAALTAAGAALSTAASQADNSLVTAPFDGVVGRIWAREGNTVGGEPLFSLTGGSVLAAWICLPEDEVGRLERGDRAEIHVSSSEESFPGSVSSVSPTIDPVTGLVSVEIIINDPDHLLIPGMTARVRVCTETLDQILAVPSTALVPTSVGFSVAVAQGTRASLVPVEIGMTEGSMVRVTTGLAPGDQVIVQGGQMVADGGTIIIEGQAPPDSISGMQ